MLLPEDAGPSTEYLEYPFWSSRIFDPFSVIFDECVCKDDEFSHDGDEGDF